MGQSVGFQESISPTIDGLIKRALRTKKVFRLTPSSSHALATRSRSYLFAPHQAEGSHVHQIQTFVDINESIVQELGGFNYQ